MKLIKGLFTTKGNSPYVPPTDPYNLDNPLLYLSPVDSWTIRDACEGTQIFGAIGSGKTSGSGAAIAKAFLRFGFGGLVLCAKPEERKLWELYAAETGRSAQGRAQKRSRRSRFLCLLRSVASDTSLSFAPIRNRCAAQAELMTRSGS